MKFVLSLISNHFIIAFFLGEEWWNCIKGLAIDSTSCFLFFLLVKLIFLHMICDKLHWNIGSVIDHQDI